MRKWLCAVVACVFTGMSLCGPAIADEIVYRFDQMWPTLRQPWYFDGPYGVAADTYGAVYVADGYNRRIQKFSSGGEFITAWGTEGTAQGQFEKPTDIIADSNGNVFVVDKDRACVLRFTSSGAFVAEWGSGQLSAPAGIAADAFSRVYVADTGNHRIRVYDNAGTFVASWGSQGTGNRQFSSPRDVALDAAGNVYVADTGNHRIQVLDSNGGFVAAWGSEGGGNGQFGLPVGIALDAQGNIFVADAGNAAASYPVRIQEFDASGVFIASWGTQGEGRGEFYEPDGIAIAPNGQVLVTDCGFHDFVHVFTPQGVNEASWGSQLSGENEYRNPYAIEKDASGNIYVADFGNARIQKLDSEGNFATVWGPQTGQAGACEQPYDIAIASQGYVYVADLHDQYIRRYATDGTYQLQFGGSGFDDGQFAYFLHICVDADGNVYATDTTGDRVEKFNASGTYLSQFGATGIGAGQFKEPRGIAFGAGGYLYVADSKNNRIQKFRTDGSFVTMWGSTGTGAGQFSRPMGVEVGPAGDVFVADTDNHRIQRFTSSGVFVAAWGEFGSGPGQLDGPADALALDDGRVIVADRLNNRIQRFRVLTQAENAKAIIVAGGGPFPGNQLWDTTELCANYAYRVLNYQGYDKARIHYLSSDVTLDLDNNGVADDVSATATKANLEAALTQWSAGADTLSVYLVDHGGVGTFRLNETETLEAAELASWLDAAQGGISGRLTFVIDACHSSSFVPLLAKSANVNRTVIGSTPSDQPAYFLGLGSVSFSGFFWNEIFNAQSVGDAFAVASESLHLTVPNQIPELDADGDGVSNTSNDVTAGQTIFLGNKVLGDDKPVIGSASAPQVITGTSSASFYVQNVSPSDSIFRVWAVIRPPNNPSEAPTSSKAVLDLPTTSLWPTGIPGEYEGSYDAFTTPGTYQLALYAQDRALNISVPNIVSISVDSPMRRRAIIVGGAETTEAPADLIDQQTNLAYDTLRFQGYTDADIRYFNMRTVSTGVDGLPTLSNLQSALVEWAATETEDLVLYLVGSGGSGRFEINDGESLFAMSLKNWLDQLQTTLAGPVVVIYDACASGSFLPVLTAPSGKTRIVISSTQAEASAAFTLQGGLSFSQFFWRQVLTGANLRSAFQYAANAIRFGKEARKPQLDDNGDGIYDSAHDGAFALRYHIGAGVLLAGDEPMIGKICDTQVLNAAAKGTKENLVTSANIWVSEVTTTGNIQTVLTIVTPPGYDPYGCGVSRIEQTYLTLEPTGENRYERMYNGFVDRGSYQVSVYAMDTQGNVSLPVESTVVQEGDYATPDAYEPDDTADEASWIGLNGENQIHNFNKPADVDWARFYIEAGNTVTVQTLHLGPMADTYVELYRSDGTTLLETDDNGGTDETGRSSYLAWQADITGFYLVRVNNVVGTDYGADASYELVVGDLTGDLVPGAIACVVSDSKTALPIRNATLEIGFGSLHQHSDSKGTAVFTALPKGEYTVTASASGYESTEEDVTVTAGKVITIALALVPEAGEGEGEGEPHGCNGSAASVTSGAGGGPSGGTPFLLVVVALLAAAGAQRRTRTSPTA